MRESQADLNGMKVGEPIVFVEGNSMLVYIDLEIRIEWKPVELLTARKVMCDKGYSVFADITVPRTEEEMDYLRKVT